MSETPELEKPFDPMLEAEPVRGVVVIPPVEPARRRRLWPAAVLMILALGVLGYRLSVADWRWVWPWEGGGGSSSPAGVVSEAMDSLRESVASGEMVGPPRREADKEGGPGTEAAAVAGVEAKAEESAESADRGNAEDAAALALSDIEKEAERIRKEREELQKAKEEAGKQIAAAPPRPLFGRFVDPGPFALPQRELEAMVRQQMEEHRRLMEWMLRARPGWAGRGMQPGVEDRFERLFEQMRRDMEAFERDAEAMMREQGVLALRIPGRRGIQLPPAPGMDVPAPPQPELEDEPEGAEAEADRPQIRRRRFVTPDGTQVETFEMRWGFGDR